MVPIFSCYPSDTILFLLFVNDMPLSIRDSTLDGYADDTTLSKCSSWENVPHLTQALNQDLCSSSVTAALALMTVITQLLLWEKLLSSLLYLGQV